MISCGMTVKRMEMLGVSVKVERVTLIVKSRWNLRYCG